MSTKRIVSLLLCVLMTVSRLSVSSFAADAGRRDTEAAAGLTAEQAALAQISGSRVQAGGDAGAVRGLAQPKANGDPCTLKLFIDPGTEAGTIWATPGGTHYVGQTVTLHAVAKA